MLRYWPAFAALIAGNAVADFVSTAPETVEIVVYRDPTTDDFSDDAIANGLVMVNETRTVDLPQGTSTLTLRGVADQIVPQTAKLDGESVTVVESNFDYDLLTPGTLIANSIGRAVKVVRTNSQTGAIEEISGVLRSGPQGVVLESQGKYESLYCSGRDDRLIFDTVPDSLSDSPTLSLLVNSKQSGRQRIQLSYLALGVNWSADYVARIHADGQTLDLSGWITLVNHSATTYANAPTHVVAGELSRKAETRGPQIESIPVKAMCWSLPGSPAVKLDVPPMYDLDEIIVTARREETKMSELGDYKLYTLPEATTVAAHQSKQVQLLERRNVPFERIYSYRYSPYNEVERDNADVLLRLDNRRKFNLGLPLPAGKVAVMEANAQGALVFAGEQTIRDTPINLPMNVRFGTALDVWIEPVVVREETLWVDGMQRHRGEFAVRLTNNKSVPIELEFTAMQLGSAFRIVTESKRHQMMYGEPFWSVSLRPGTTKQLQYSVEWTE